MLNICANNVFPIKYYQKHSSSQYGNLALYLHRFNFEKQWAFIRFIGTHAAYDKIDAPIGSSESDEADLLALLIDDYENRNYPIEAPDPIEAIKIRMEEMHLRQIDLVNELGGKNRASEILNKKRKLTVEMIRKLADKLKLSVSMLVQDYTLTR